jgi:hypothetical protein
MPFTPGDADKHKKGLSEKAKKQWARVAESVRKREMKKGKTEKEAAAEAVKQANGVVNVNSSQSKYIVCKNKQTLEYEPKLTVHQEKAHLVVPVVMMVEGVHNGSQGPIFHSIEELGKFPDSWNGIPVVIYHPMKDDQPVSANSPEIIDTRTVGRVYNTNVDGKKLKAEVWFDEDKLNTISEGTLLAINDSKEIEVSLGMFTENEKEVGVYKEEEYTGIAHNHRPDHLAVLPDQKGACSCEDGCGIGANKNEKDMKHSEMIAKLRPAGYTIERIGKYTEQGYNELMSMVYDKLQSLNKDYEDEEGKRHYIYNYLEECYDDYLIYSKSGDNKRTMYKQSYKVESGKIEFVGEPIEVHKKVEYVVNSSLTRTKYNTNNTKEEVKMPKNECPKCLEKINKVLANKDSGFVEADREWLETLSETALDKVITPKVIEKEKVVEKTVEVNKLSAEDQADLAWAKQQREERRTNWIKSIQDNTEKDVWKEEVLKGMKDDILESIFKSLPKKEELVDYSLHGNPPVVSAGKSGSGGALYPAGIEIEQPK